MQPDRAGAPELSSLKFRLEHLKRLGNLRLDFLKSLYDRRPISELYERGDIHICVHFRSTIELCAKYRALGLRRGGERPGKRIATRFSNDLHRDEVPVFVGVGNFLEDLRPLASAVRLQPLDFCPMRGVHAAEESKLLYPSLEILLSVFNRKLCPLEVESGIEGGEIKDKIVKSSAQIIANLTNQNADAQRDFWRTKGHNIHDSVRLLRFNDLSIPLVFKELNLPFELLKMFACPRQAFERMI